LVSSTFSDVPTQHPWETSRLDVLDMSQAGEAPVVATIDRAGDVAVIGAEAYVFDGEAIDVLDRSEPARPLRLASIAFTDRFVDLAVSSPFIYLASWDPEILDVSRPTRPKMVGSIETEGYTLRVFDGCAYQLAGGDIGAESLLMFDVRDPTQPRQVGALALPRSAMIASAEVAPGIVCATGREGLRVYVPGPPVPSESATPTPTRAESTATRTATAPEATATASATTTTAVPSAVPRASYLPVVDRR
jgi:hypothetical protein